MEPKKYLSLDNLYYKRIDLIHRDIVKLGSFNFKSPIVKSSRSGLSRFRSAAAFSLSRLVPLFLSLFLFRLLAAALSLYL